MKHLKEPEYTKLLEYQRNGLIEQVHFGILIHMNKNGIIKKIGNDNNYLFYQRSCMKPIQASLLIDFELDKKFEFTLEEIAVCCASHTGDLIHQNIIKSILKKINASTDDLLLNPHTPLSVDEQKRLIINNLPAEKIHNNCSGKHSAMLAICKHNNFDISNYNDINHPLSEIVINKVCSLCETKKSEIVISKDGCGLPVAAVTLEQLGKGFLNLFLDPKYKKIKDAFLNYPYLIGGKQRLDSEIINISNNLVAKVGACGLCVVVNLDKKECIVVKIADSNMEARTNVVTQALLQIKWLDTNNVFSSRLNNIYNGEIKSQYGEILGSIMPCFNIN
ncbi:MAG: asparaginase [Candidatus Gastranaerophilales bacterium]|nr:asparaginase [Candidatus Gastranaerophilales bacterium]